MFTPEVDAKVIDHVEKHGLTNFVELGSELGFSGRKIRERWQFQLDPSINFGRWTASEDERLAHLYKQSSGSWSIISLSLPGRTELQAKSRWQSLERKKKKESKLEKLLGQEIVDLLVEDKEPPLKRKAPNPAFEAAKKLPRPDSGMKKAVFGNFGSTTSFTEINQMLARQADARSVMW